MTEIYRHATARWVRIVEGAISLSHDPKTMDEWAHCVGVSRTKLKSLCAAVGLSGKLSLDFARLLRASIRAEYDGVENALDILDIEDKRTLAKLCIRAGLHEPCTSPAAFIAEQKIVTSPSLKEAVSSIVDSRTINVRGTIAISDQKSGHKTARSGSQSN